MISTDRTRVKIRDVVSSQLPSFIRNDYPLINEFFREYYASQEYSGSTLDLLQNIDQYFDLDSLLNHSKTCILDGDIDEFSTTIPVVYNPSENLLGTYGFPERYGLLKINDEIILYKSRTNSTFDECVRGFSGINKYGRGDNPEQLVFTETNAATHTNQAEIENLSILFLEKFLTKLKNQFLPGLEDREISPKVNQKTLIGKISDFYDSKGTEESIKILFGVLYGEEVKVINPKDFILTPSDAIFRKTKDIVVEALEGDPLRLRNRTLVQDSIPEYGIKRAEASVTDVEIVKTNEKDYYRIKLDYEYDDPNNANGNSYASFVPHPNTRTTTQVSLGSTVIDVDSTVGFPNSGNIVVALSNGSTESLSYTSKSLTQFFGLDSLLSSISIGSTVRLDTNAYGYPGISTSDVVKVRIGSIFNKVNILDNTFYFSKDDAARITYPGIANTTAKSNDWLLNIPIRYRIENVSQLDSSGLTYRVKTFDDNIFSVGDSATLIDSSFVELNCNIISILDSKTFTIRGQGSLSTSGNYFIERKIKKSNVSDRLPEYEYIDNYNADVQTVYTNFNGDVLVASPSIPFYKNQPLSFYDKKIPLDGTYSGDTLTISSFPTNVSDHGYYTGDSVFYRKGLLSVDEDGDGISFEIESKFTDFDEGVYFVKRVSQNQLKLARSRSDIFRNNFLSISGIVTSNYIEPAKFRNSSIKPQNILRWFKTPDTESGVYETPTDASIGMFVNGVELSNYKSSDFVKYGEIERCLVSRSGDDYDVINPPLLSITDSVGVGATGAVSVIGNLKQIQIIDTGFDYITDPVIDITGGNGFGAEAKVNTSLIEHSVSFNADGASAFVNLTDNTIGFSTYHKFRSVEQIVYKTEGESGIVGLNTDSFYYVKSIDPLTVKIFNTELDANAGINTVSLNGYGTGIHRLETTGKKKIVTSILVTNPGENYQNKERTCVSSGISTSLNHIIIENHGYESGEIVVYSTSGTSISGISTTLTYVVTKVDENSFKLSSVGIGSTSKYFYYESKQYLDLRSTGSGVHTFNYEPISVKINGVIGVATVSGQNFGAIIQPIFRGEISSVNIESGGVGYGSSDILNYDRQPNYNFLTGKDAELIPVVNNGSISEVIVNYVGEQYNSAPNLLISGIGTNAILTPVIRNGQLTSVKVVNGGSGYNSSTAITVVPSGRGAALSFDIKQWNVNAFQKSLNILSEDDGILKEAINDEYGIQYAHIYTPRKLRESVYQKTQDNQIQYGVFDLQKVNDQEINSQYHSPIIGWAYDGNPIYGPYGFTTRSGGSIRLMRSGYQQVDRENRPSFPRGFFVEDYQFVGDGDLDEHNGRYCVTPEYPNGTYAYFTTIDDSVIESSFPFIGYRKPKFPYVIGNTFRSKPIDFNFNKLSNQDSYDLTGNGDNENDGPWLRNTTAYNFQSEDTFYDYFFNPLKEKEYLSTIKTTSTGGVEHLNIIDSGSDYKVGDKIIFNNKDTDGIGASAFVSEIIGKEVSTIGAATTIIYDAEISPFDSDGKYIVFTNSPHELLDRDTITISGVTTSTSGLDGSFTIGVTSERYSLATAIGNTSITGIVTYISLSGNLSNITLRENDVLQIESEKFKVLNLDLVSSRIRVLREFDGSVGAAHSATSLIVEKTRKFTFNSIPQPSATFERNREIYFNPEESVGLGSTGGVGIGYTLNLPTVGAGISQIFIPTGAIYIPNHNLVTGEPIVYSNNDGSSIVVSNGSSIFSLNDSSTVYAANISRDLLGISTERVGLGSTGTFVGINTVNGGLLYFVGLGSGTYHSFTTNKEKAVKCEVTKNIVTVSTASSHGLSLGDSVTIDVKPTTQNNIVIKYNDYNRRMVVNPKDFTALDVDINLDTIRIENHKFKTGDVVIHTSSSPSGGLENEKIYYVIRYTKDLIKLSTSKYGTETFEKDVVDITSVSSGTISPINPEIEVYKDNIVVFDLSDSSLSSTSGVTTYSSFEFKLYQDEQFTQEFYGTLFANSLNVSNFGQVGVSTNARTVLNIDNRVPSKLFYRLKPINSSFVPSVKSEIIVDEDVVNNNLLKITTSNYSGSFTLSGIGTTTFNYYLTEFPEESQYTSNQASLSYNTTSTQASGGISTVKVTYSGYGYTKLPGISTIRSDFGTDAILEPTSSGIGTIISISPDLISYDYPTDKTLRPLCNLPEVFEVLPLNKIDYIGVTSAGNGYSVPPQLVLIDQYTNTVVRDVDLRFVIGDKFVQVLKNVSGISGQARIVPVNNSNGVKIGSINFNSTTKDVTVGLNTGFSDSFPFSVGDKVLIENVSVGVNTTGKGYNSENYNYNLFTLTSVPEGTSGLGGLVGVVTFSMAEFLTGDETPGNFDPINSYGRIIAEKDFPIFDIRLKKSSFAKEELVVSGNKVGRVESWNENVNILKLSSSREFATGDIIKGQGTKTTGVVGKKYDFDAYVDTSAASEIVIGWANEIGFLNNNLHRLQNNEYYQNFSYTIKSKIPFEDWDNVVSSLSHNSGFVKFSDLQLESINANTTVVATSNDGSTVDVINDFVTQVDLSCYQDYDSVFENKLNISDRIVSSEIYFSNRVLTDYFESVGNRVLTIDDISSQFNSEPRSTPYSIIDEFSINQKVKKYFTYIRDKRFIGERQSMFVSIAHNGVDGYLNQYGRVETSYDLGSFDVAFSESSGRLLFYPTLYEVNDFDISYLSFDLDSSISGIGSTTLGDTVKIKTQRETVLASSTGTIISIGSSYRASKIIVQIDSVDDIGVHEMDELNVIHDGSTVQLLEYGQMTTSGVDSYEPSGLGTYSAYITGSDLNIDLTVNPGIGTVVVNSIQISIANTSSTGIGTYYFGFDNQKIAYIDSFITTIAASPTPTQNTIAQYNNETTSDDQQDASYFVVCVEDVTNGHYQMSEVIVVDDETEAYITEYGNVETVSGLGTIGAGAGTTFTELYFTPNPNIDVQVRVFHTSLQLVNFASENPELELNLNNGELNVGYGGYSGTFSDVKRAFGLLHGGREIFQRSFFGNDTSVVDVVADTIVVPEHFFVTGEELVYSHAGVGNTQAIGIASTDFGVGIGTTDKMPSKVFAIKVDDRKIRLARSAEDALKGSPVSLDIVNVGIGTSHTLTSKNQNGKCLIALDNYIQSPIVPTSVTTGLSTHVSLFDNILVVSGINSFFGGDLIRVDDEVMRISSVGFGSTNHILVRRPWMGTGLSTHSDSATVTKIQGNYNIVQNEIHFVDAPRGPIPIGTSTNKPDERDWTGISTFSKFQGRTFLRNGEIGSTEETYAKNYIFDDISSQFDATTKTFTLKSEGQNVTGFSTSNSIILVNGVFQGPQGTLIPVQDYELIESAGITSISFLGAATSVSSDPNTASIPVGGVIISVGSTGGLGYQPLVSAGGTAIVSIAGTISSISIGNSGSGYRSGIQTVVNVSVYTSSTTTSNIEFIGTATINNGHIVSIAITNPGSGYTSTNPPSVLIDAPLSYSNIPLIYSSSGPNGIGTEATVNIVVGQGSSVIDFEISNLGYNYGNNQILTVSTGGSTGIPTDISKPFREFQISIEKIASDNFAGWNVGDLEVFDKIEDEFDGIRRTFTISKDGSPVTIRAKQGSNIDVQSTLLVFLNDILQSPGDGYTFTGGSVITFAEAPKAPFDGIDGTGDTCKILFYKGSGEIDVQFTDVIETVKVGDSLTINDSKTTCVNSIQQDERLVTDIISSDTVETNPYVGPGISDDTNCIRPVTWCQQRTDKLINGKIVGKSRNLYEPVINPTAYMIQSVGSGTTIIYVDSVKTFFDSDRENLSLVNLKKIVMVSSDEVVGASATAVVSAAGTVSSITITDGGYGYVSPPEVSISNPVGFGTSERAQGISTITSDTVTSISVSYGGTNYSQSNPPQVLIGHPTPTYELNEGVTYEGDFGNIVGISTTSVGVASTGIVFDLHIPLDSYLRSSEIMGISGVTTISGIQTGYYFVVQNSNVGNSGTSLYSDGAILGIGTQFLDNVYEVAAVSIAQTSIPGVGNTNIARVTVSVTNNQISGIGYTSFFGQFSWGRILLGTRITPKEFNAYTLNGSSGISTSAFVSRLVPLKYNNYL
jgi:hypothetical protein